MSRAVSTFHTSSTCFFSLLTPQSNELKQRKKVVQLSRAPVQMLIGKLIINCRELAGISMREHLHTPESWHAVTRGSPASHGARWFSFAAQEQWYTYMACLPLRSEKNFKVMQNSPAICRLNRNFFYRAHYCVEGKRSQQYENSHRNRYKVGDIQVDIDQNDCFRGKDLTERMFAYFQCIHRRVRATNGHRWP